MIKKHYKRFRHWMAFSPPGALTAEGWDYFNREFATTAPIRWFFHDTFKVYAVYPVSHTYDTISDYIRYRTTRRFHIMETGEKPGYMSMHMRMLHANFNLLKRYVEHNLAKQSYWNNDVPKSWSSRHIPFYWSFVKFEGRKFGLIRLDWEASLDDPSLPIYSRAEVQAQSAREFRELYIWWVDRRPAREKFDYNDYYHSQAREDDYVEEDKAMLLRLSAISDRMDY